MIPSAQRLALPLLCVYAETCVRLFVRILFKQGSQERGVSCGHSACAPHKEQSVSSLAGAHAPQHSSKGYEDVAEKDKMCDDVRAHGLLGPSAARQSPHAMHATENDVESALGISDAIGAKLSASASACCGHGKCPLASSTTQDSTQRENKGWTGWVFQCQRCVSRSLLLGLYAYGRKLCADKNR